MSLINDRPRTAASILEDRLDPAGLVYLLVTNVAHERLSSGQYHIYRGVLNFQGQELERAFVTASRQMVKHRVHDQRAHDIEVAALRKELAALGQDWRARVLNYRLARDHASMSGPQVPDRRKMLFNLPNTKKLSCATHPRCLLRH